MFNVLTTDCKGPSSFPIFSVTKYAFLAIFKNPAFTCPIYDTGYGSGEFNINNVIKKNITMTRWQNSYNLNIYK